HLPRRAGNAGVDRGRATTAAACEVVGRFGVLRLVDACNLVLGGHSATGDGLDDQAEDRRDHTGVDHDDDHRQHLLAQQVDAAAVEQAVRALTVRHDARRGDETEHDGTDQTTDEVDADDVEGVVVAEAVFQAHRGGTGDTGDRTDGQG